MILLHKVLALALVAFPHLAAANEGDSDVRTPEFTIDVPKDQLFLVAVDRGTGRNGAAGPEAKNGEAQGVDPVLGQMMRSPAQVRVSLSYPQRRANSKASVAWTVNAGYKYMESDALESGAQVTTKWDWSVGYNFEMATRTQKVVYQHEGKLHHDFERNIVETPITPRLKEVPTDVDGVRLYRIPFGEVEGVTRSVVVLVSDSFEKAEGLLPVSDSNPKFRWTTDWFHEQPAQN